jgi:branched-chain amino acid aminotransferase
MFQIIDSSIDILPLYSLNPWNIKLGRDFAPNMFVCSFKEDWQDATLQPIENFSLHPASVVLHYSQSIFEGVKAYRSESGDIRLFRPELNARRFNQSAERMVLPTIEEADFLEALDAVVRANKSHVPDSPGYLYLRPALLGTEACIGPEAGKEALFFILALPGGPLFSSFGEVVGQIDVQISYDVARASRGGTGSVKVGANYAVSMRTNKDAKRFGCAQVLYLDPLEGKYVEELGGMNIFFSDGKKLITPSLTQSMLGGVTRRSVIELATHLGVPVDERRIEIRELEKSISDGTIIESFGCGTAAAITAIRSLRSPNNSIELKFKNLVGSLTKLFHEELTSIQFGTKPDKMNWMRKVKSIDNCEESLSFQPSAVDF